MKDDMNNNGKEFNKLFIGFIKRNGIFCFCKSKYLIDRFKGKEALLMPFNSFTWAYTVQGRLYWINKSVLWLCFLYKHASDKCLKKSIEQELMNFVNGWYCTKEQLKNQPSFEPLQEALLESELI